MTRLILCAGMMRSGGTWLFNAVKAICAQAGRSTYGAWIMDFDEASGAADDTIVKIHGADDAMAARAAAIFTCHRDLRDVAVSLETMRWIHGDPAKLGLLAQTVEEYEYWAPRAACDFRYDAIVGKPADCIAKIADALKITGCDAQGIADTLDAIPLPTEPGYDRTTLLHPNHRNDGRPGRWRGQLERVRLAIESRFGDWLRAKGYET